MSKYGKDFVIVGCSDPPQSDAISGDDGGLETLKKWLVDVQCEGCKGLYYRSAPHQIVPDADWPRNGDVVVGSAIPDIPGEEYDIAFELSSFSSLFSNFLSCRLPFSYF